MPICPYVVLDVQNEGAKLFSSTAQTLASVCLRENHSLCQAAVKAFSNKQKETESIFFNTSVTYSKCV